MSALQDQNAIEREMFGPQVHGNAVVPADARQENTMVTIDKGPDYALESAAEKQFREPPDTESQRTARRNAYQFIGSLQQSDIAAQRQSPRIAFKAKSRIVFLDLAEIAAVQAAGNYVSLQHRPNPYLVRESLSSILEKLKPYGFIRIHRSVVVNTLMVEEIQPLPTGEYRLRLRGGKEYMVTRTYKNNLKHLAHLWLGTESLL